MFDKSNQSFIVMKAKTSNYDFDNNINFFMRKKYLAINFPSYLIVN